MQTVRRSITKRSSSYTERATRRRPSQPVRNNLYAIRYVFPQTRIEGVSRIHGQFSHVRAIPGHFCVSSSSETVPANLREFAFVRPCSSAFPVREDTCATMFRVQDCQVSPGPVLRPSTASCVIDDRPQMKGHQQTLNLPHSSNSSFGRASGSSPIPASWKFLEHLPRGILPRARRWIVNGQEAA